MSSPSRRASWVAAAVALLAGVAVAVAVGLGAAPDAAPGPGSAAAGSPVAGAGVSGTRVSGTEVGGGADRGGQVPTPGARQAVEQAPDDAPGPPESPPAPTPTVRPPATPTPTEEPPAPASTAAPAPAKAPAAPAPEPAPAPPGTRDVESRVLSLANEARRTAGLAPLRAHDGLTSVARGWSEQLAAAGAPLAHNPDHAAQVPGGWSALGENVAWIDDGGRLSPEEVARRIHQGWMDSPGHRENILRPGYTHLGVGVGHHPEHGWYLTQNFATF